MTVTRTLRDTVMAREDWCCARCGRWVGDRPHSLHHRQPRGMGGTSVPDDATNLVLLCGSGVGLGCHPWVESNRLAAYEQGWLVRRGQDPAATPIHRLGRWQIPSSEGWLDVPGPIPQQRRGP